MNASIVAQIDARLTAIKRDNDVEIPLAIESGSRAWGFPSPDSDYDCRFVFVRSRNSYLSLFPRRSVIETPLDGDLDVNGWDLAKALKLLLKGNAVIIEWLTSPVIYSADDKFRSEFQELANRVVDRTLVSRHYLHLGQRQRRTYFRDEKAVPLKKVFYALRPAAALRWLRLHQDKCVAPMHFPSLVAECDAPPDVRRTIEDLIERKSQTRELGKAALPRAISEFIDNEFRLAADGFLNEAPSSTDQAKADVDAFFRKYAVSEG